MKKKNKRPAPQDIPLLHETSVACANECTGICPTVPMSDAEADAYKDIAPVDVTPSHRLNKQ